MHQYEGKVYGEHPIPKLEMFLFDTDDSAALQELQRNCRRATARVKNDPLVAYEECVRSLTRAVQVVKEMPLTDRGVTDREGFFRFENVPPGKRYQVVAVIKEEDHPVLIVGLTPSLKPGQQAELKLSENEPWTDADPMKK